jgi:hypothetical protein
LNQSHESSHIDRFPTQIFWDRITLKTVVLYATAHIERTKTTYAKVRAVCFRLNLSRGAVEKNDVGSLDFRPVELESVERPQDKTDAAAAGYQIHLQAD